MAGAQDRAVDPVAAAKWIRSTPPLKLSLDDGFYLPVEKGPPWYGISSDTVSRGFEQLIHDELLAVDINQKKAPLSPQGFTTERHYTLKPPFGPVRAQAQALPKRRTVKRPEGSL